MFRGSIVALVTPMKDNAVDIHALRDLVEWHIGEGTHGLVAAGTTGESGTLTHAEKSLVIKTVIEHARERIPVIAGTHANSTQDCTALTKEAMEQGAHAVLIMTPAYIKPTQEGLYLHYSSIAKSAPIPIILYNVPSRTACDLLPETVARLSAISNIVGLKDATGSMDRLKALLHEECDLDIFSGDDVTAYQWMKNGAKGVISVTGNIIPKTMAKICDALFDGETDLAEKLHQPISGLHEKLFVQSNPIPVKWALSRMGRVQNELRLPLTALSESLHPELEALLTKFNLI